MSGVELHSRVSLPKTASADVLLFTPALVACRTSGAKGPQGSGGLVEIIQYFRAWVTLLGTKIQTAV